MLSTWSDWSVSEGAPLFRKVVGVTPRGCNAVAWLRTMLDGGAKAETEGRMKAWMAADTRRKRCIVAMVKECW